MRLLAEREIARSRLVGVVRAQRRLLGNAGSMLGTTVVTSLLGVAFWWLAAHQFSEQAVGVAAAAVGAMTLLGFLATLGFGTLLMGELPRLESGHRSLINAALAITAAAGSILGVLFAAIAPLVSSNFEPLDSSSLALLAFAIGVGLTALAFVLDQALIGLLYGTLQLRRNVVFSLVKLLALVPIATLIADPGAAWIYSAWAAGIAISLLVLTRFYRHRGEDSLQPDFALLMSMRLSAASHHVFNLALQIPALLLPVLVVGLVSAAANAAFYIAWMIAGLLIMVPVSLATVLYPIGSGDPGRMGQGLKLTLAISLAFGLAANLFLLVAAEPLMGIFGASYAEQGTATLQILALGVFPLTFKTLYVSVRRVQRKLGPALPIVWGGTALELVGAVLGTKVGGGLTGFALGWLAAVCVEGLVMGGDVLRALPGVGVSEREHDASGGASSPSARP
ncbi:MAG TPA: MATE family efflux transporter [Solirubrobacterales bacterium]